MLCSCSTMTSQGEHPFDMVDAANHLEALGNDTLTRGPMLSVTRLSHCDIMSKNRMSFCANIVWVQNLIAVFFFCVPQVLAIARASGWSRASRHRAPCSCESGSGFLDERLCHSVFRIHQVHWCPVIVAIRFQTYCIHDVHSRWKTCSGSESCADDPWEAPPQAFS